MRQFVTAVFLLASVLSLADDDILVNVTLDGKAATLIFDTGSEATVLWARAARRLGIRTVRAPAVDGLTRGGNRTRRTQTCELTAGPVSTSTSFEIVTTLAPIARKTDGVLAWETIRDQLLRVDGRSKQLTFPPRLPEDINQWQSWRIYPDLNMLSLELRGVRKRHQGLVFIDTGAHLGVCLATDLWERHRARLTAHGHTLHALFNPRAGAAVREVLWAPTLELGPLILENVTVRQCYRFDEDFFGRRKGHTYRATLGLQALHRTDLLIDGKEGVVYTRPILGSPSPDAIPDHNRLGAVFVPASKHSYTLEAHVLDDSPAHKAGLRDEDMLLAIGDTPVAQWRSNPDRPPLSSFWNQPTGTELTLTIRRRSRDNTVNVTLKDLLIADAASAPERQD